MIYLDRVIDSMEFYLDDIVFPYYGYVTTLSTAVELVPVEKNPTGLFMYRAPHRRWVYFNRGGDYGLPNGSLTTAVTTPNNQVFVNYADGLVAYNYNVRQQTGSLPTARYTYKLLDYRSSDIGITEAMVYGNDLAPPAIVQFMDSSRQEPAAIGLSNEKQYREFSFVVCARNAREKKKMRSYMADAFSPRSRVYGAKTVDFDTHGTLNSNGDKNTSFVWTTQVRNCMNFSDKMDTDIPELIAATAAQFRFHYAVTVMTVE